MTNKTIDLSIIIISYNEIKYLSNCINSCLSLKEKIKIEIIVGDDGSNDGSIEIIKNYSEQFPNLFRYFVMDRNITEPVIGSLRASNIIKHALQIVHGKFCYLISGDDYISNINFFIEAIDFLKNNSNNYSVVVANSFSKVYSNNFQIITIKKMPPKLYWTGNYLHISCFIFESEIAKKNILDRFCDDTGLQFSLLQGKKWKYLEYNAFNYRQQENSIMHKSDTLELALLEIMILQDILNKKTNIRSIYSFSRFSAPLNLLFKNRNLLRSNKYIKYINNSKNYFYDFINTILLYNDKSFFLKLKFHFFLFYVSIINYIFKIIRYFVSIFYNTRQHRSLF